MAKTDLLAVAFTDLNGNHKFNAGKDALIAALVDTNKDGTVDVGDTVTFGTYPAIPDGSASGTGGIFNGADQTVTAFSVDSTSVLVNTAAGLVEWGVDRSAELFSTVDTAGHLESRLIDSISDTTIQDQIFADATVHGPGLPNTGVSELTFQQGDQGFLDVFIV